jgi:hypothetical protein
VYDTIKKELVSLRVDTKNLSKMLKRAASHTEIADLEERLTSSDGKIAAIQADVDRLALAIAAIQADKSNFYALETRMNFQVCSLIRLALKLHSAPTFLRRLRRGP